MNNTCREKKMHRGMNVGGFTVYERKLGTGYINFLHDKGG